MECNFRVCRHNVEGVCDNKGEREICVDVAKDVLCLPKDEVKDSNSVADE